MPGEELVIQIHLPFKRPYYYLDSRRKQDSQIERIGWIEALLEAMKSKSLCLFITTGLKQRIEERDAVTSYFLLELVTDKHWSWLRFVPQKQE